MSVSDVQAAVSFLRKHDLIKVDHRDYLEITTKGFDVARDRGSQKAR